MILTDMPNFELIELIELIENLTPNESDSQSSL